MFSPCAIIDDELEVTSKTAQHAEARVSDGERKSECERESELEGGLGRGERGRRRERRARGAFTLSRCIMCCRGSDLVFFFATISKMRAHAAYVSRVPAAGLGPRSRKQDAIATIPIASGSPRSSFAATVPPGGELEAACSRARQPLSRDLPPRRSEIGGSLLTLSTKSRSPRA